MDRRGWERYSVQSRRCETIFSAFVFVKAISFRKWIRRFVCTAAAVASVDNILRISVLAKGEAPTTV